MSRRGIAALALALTLAACAPPQAPAPIALSYPYAAGPGLNLDRLRALAPQVSGAYVRVLVYQEGRGPDMPSRSVVNGASGTVIDPRGIIVTAAHIAKDARYSVEVTTIDGRVRPAAIIDIAPERELAVLKIDPVQGLEAPKRADPGSLRPGEPVLAIGTPNNRPGAVSFGRVIKARRVERIEYGEYGYDDAVELEMEIEAGYSGGPVFDAEGRLIGILASFGLGDTRRVPYVSTRLAYAIPISAVTAYIAEIAARGALP